MLRLTEGYKDSFNDLANIWRLTEQEAHRLLGTAEPIWTLQELKKCHLLIRIYQNLGFMPGRQLRAWPKTPNDNPLFGSKPPLELMSTGLQGLKTVLKHLKAQNGGPL